jgi:peptidoglycan/LPS O-acetylase OafA/YrhL
MTDTVTYVIELAVGVASLAMAWPSWRRGGWFRLVGAVLAVAGVAAIVHAVPRLS